MKLIGYLLLVALFISWIAVLNFCFDLLSAPSDAKLYLGIGIMLASVVALRFVAERIITTFKTQTKEQK